MWNILKKRENTKKKILPTFRLFCLFQAVKINPVNLRWWFRFHSLNISYDNIDVNVIVLDQPVAYKNNVIIDNPQKWPCNQESFSCKAQNSDQEKA